MGDKSNPRPTDAELALLRVLWTRGPSTVREVHDALAGSRTVAYTTTLSSCVLDDPSDGVGAATGAPCRPLVSGSGGGGTVSTSGATSLNLNVLGIQVTGGGALVEVVCSLFGTRGSIVDQLLGSGGLLGGLVNTVADTTFCSGGKGTVAMDRQPVDATAVTVSVTWPQTRSGRGGTVTQRVSPQVGRNTVWLPAPPATMTWISPAASAMGIAPASVPSLNNDGRRVRISSSVSGANDAAATRVPS